MIFNCDSIIRQCKTDSESVYDTWFINNEERAEDVSLDHIRAFILL